MAFLTTSYKHIADCNKFMNYNFKADQFNKLLNDQSLHSDYIL